MKYPEHIILIKQQIEAANTFQIKKLVLTETLVDFIKGIEELKQTFAWTPLVVNELYFDNVHYVTALCTVNQELHISQITTQP